MLEQTISIEIHNFCTKHPNYPTGILIHPKTWEALITEIFGEMESSEMERFYSGKYRNLEFFRSYDIEENQVKVF